MLRDVRLRGGLNITGNINIRDYVFNELLIQGAEAGFEPGTYCLYLNLKHDDMDRLTTTASFWLNVEIKQHLSTIFYFLNKSKNWEEKEA